MKISVVMASYLGEYPGCASNREYKFKRAVDSFLNQTYDNKELIIVSDGCDITENIYNELYKDNENITLSKIEKDVTFGGNTRNKGIELSSGDYICYLDSDDFFSENHLKKIENWLTSNILNDIDWAYYNDRLLTSFNTTTDFTYSVRDNIVGYGRIGTSAIVHRKFDDLKWGVGYGHDWYFIQQLSIKSSQFIKIEAEYNVCHMPNYCDF